MTDEMDKMLEFDGEGDGKPAPAPEGNTALARYSQQAELSPEDVYIPNLRLAQGLTPEVQAGDARPGQWLVTGFEPQAEVVVVPLAFFKRREYFDRDTRETKCASNDSVVGVGDPGGECKVCPLSQWSGEKPDRLAPLCNFSYEYIVYSDTHQALAILKFTKTALRAGKILNTAVAQAGLGNIAMKLRADAKQGPRGAYFSPMVAPTKVDPAILETARQRFAEQSS